VSGIPRLIAMVGLLALLPACGSLFAKNESPAPEAAGTIPPPAGSDISVSTGTLEPRATSKVAETTPRALEIDASNDASLSATDEEADAEEDAQTASLLPSSRPSLQFEEYQPFEPPEVVLVQAGPFLSGSDQAEREAAYRLDEDAYGHDETRRAGWYENELARERRTTGAFFITRRLITNRDYAYFIAATGTNAPDVGPRTWALYKLSHDFPETRKFAWTNGRPPRGREDHPVVLVSYREARMYAQWLSVITGETWRLPSELEWEKAMRGLDGRPFPWGKGFDPGLLNSADAGPNDTMPAGSFSQAQSPFGVLDAAGQVYQWTATAPAPGFRIVKGGSWADKGCGICRPAARHQRSIDLKHILIGIRLVREVSPERDKPGKAR
jgi:formylglycine-generating enzyme required for sulfatase activity